MVQSATKARIHPQDLSLQRPTTDTASIEAGTNSRARSCVCLPPYRDQDASIWTQLYRAIAVNTLCSESTAHTDGGRILDVVVIFLRQRLVSGVASSAIPARSV